MKPSKTQCCARVERVEAPIRWDGTLICVSQLTPRVTVEDPSQWRRMASTPWRASLAMDFQKRLISRLTLKHNYMSPCCLLSFLFNLHFKDVPDVFTRLSHFLPWMNTTILSNGGLASCDFALTAEPSQGRIRT